MFCDINFATKAGLVHNEDAVYADPDLLIVMDGASGLNGIHLTPAPTDACWLAGETVSRLADRLKRPENSIPQALADTAAELKAQMFSYGYQDDPFAFPSGSLMLAREAGDRIELFSLGDCTALAAFHDDRSVLHFHDDAVTRLDGMVLSGAAELAREKGISVADALPHFHGMLVGNRMQRNKEGGYWIFEPAGLGIHHGQSLLLPKAEVRSLALMSDGFYDIVEQEDGPTHRQLLEWLETAPADELIRQLFAQLEKDPQLNRLPRFKTKDDATVAFARVC